MITLRLFGMVRTVNETHAIALLQAGTKANQAIAQTA